MDSSTGHRVTRVALALVALASLAACSTPSPATVAAGGPTAADVQPSDDRPPSDAPTVDELPPETDEPEGDEDETEYDRAPIDPIQEWQPPPNVRLVGAPRGALVTVQRHDDTRIGADLALPPGKHVFTLHDVCIGETRKTATVRAERVAKVDFAARRPTGEVRFDVRSETGGEIAATILRSGHYLGPSSKAHRVPSCREDDRLLRTNYFEVTAPGHASRHVAVVVEPNAKHRVAVVLQNWKPAAEVRDWNGVVAQADFARELRDADAACAADPARCVRAGHLYSAGEMVEVDARKAAAYFDRACAAKVGEACYRAARMLSRSEPASDAAIQLWGAAVALGEVDGLTDMAWLAEQGIGRDIDYYGATRAYFYACLGGSRVGCAQAARLAHQGTIVPRDIERGLGGFLMACEMTSHEPNWGCFYAAEVIAEHGSALRFSDQLKEREPSLRESACQSGIPAACAHPP